MYLKFLPKGLLFNLKITAMARHYFRGMTHSSNSSFYCTPLTFEKNDVAIECAA